VQVGDVGLGVAERELMQQAHFMEVVLYFFILLL